MESTSVRARLSMMLTLLGIGLAVGASYAKIAVAKPSNPISDSRSVFTPHASTRGFEVLKKVNVVAVVPNGDNPEPAATALLGRFLKHYQCNLPGSDDGIITTVLSGGSPMDNPGDLYQASYWTYCKSKPSIDGLEDEGTGGMLAYAAIASDYCEERNCNLVYHSADGQDFYMGRVQLSREFETPELIIK